MLSSKNVTAGSNVSLGRRASQTSFDGMLTSVHATKLGIGVIEEEAATKQKKPKFGQEFLTERVQRIIDNFAEQAVD
jgi:hypothetical protein